MTTKPLLVTITDLPEHLRDACIDYVQAVNAIKQWEEVKNLHAATLAQAVEAGTLPAAVELPDGRSIRYNKGRKNIVFHDEVKLALKSLQDRAKEEGRFTESVGSPFFKVLAP
jgi:hypothetical protein